MTPKGRHIGFAFSTYQKGNSVWGVNKSPGVLKVSLGRFVLSFEHFVFY